MGIVNFNIPYKDFLFLMDGFSRAVKAKIHEPIPYRDYKEFNRALHNTSDDIVVEYDAKFHDMVIYTSAGEHFFPVDGNSFGAFLFDVLHIELELYDKDIWNNKNVNINENKSVKEDNAMKFNFDFGPVSGNAVRMSMYGLAVKNKSGTWVSYDTKSGDVMDVDVFNFDGAKFLYKMPVAIKDISVGDVIVHHNAPMFVVGVPTDGKAVTAVDPIAGERKEIMLTKSPFGFNFVTKVVNFLGDTLSGGASAENPFGNLGLMMMLSEDGNGVKDMLPLMLMANGGSIDMSNPLMMYALMSGDGKMGDMLPFLFMMNANKPAAPAHECKCGGHCGEN